MPKLMEQAAERAGDNRLSIVRTRRFVRVVEAYMALLGQGGDPEAASEAFRLGDVARMSSVQRALTAASARNAIRDPELAKLAREEQDLGQRVSSLSDIVVELLSRPAEQRPEGVIARMRTDIDALRAKRRALLQEIERRFPDYADLLNPKPVSFKGAQALLRAGEALVTLYATEDRTFVWALNARGDTKLVVAPLARKERDALVKSVRGGLDLGDVGLAGFPAFDTAAAHALFQKLLGPVEAVWKDATTLYVVPHGSLGQVPFGVLVTAEAGPLADERALFDRYRKVPFLAKRVALAQLPSVSTLASLRGTRRAREPATSFIGFGDPIFSARQDRAAPAQLASRSFHMRNLSIAVVARPDRDAQAAPTAAANSSGIAQLAALPDTADEIREIARMVKAGTGDVFLGRDASETNVKRTNLADRRIVAFATHGLVPGDLDGLTQPALALSAPEVTGNKDEDGLLKMDEVLGLRLNADWVVLSACNTASASGSGAEALSGLGKAFFYAGARALLVSNWPVETVSARLLTTGVFRQETEHAEMNRAQALRAAMLEVMDRGGGADANGNPQFSYAHPVFWAPFTLVGDAGGK
jgi:CHAT domain-containing protein